MTFRGVTDLDIAAFDLLCVITGEGHIEPKRKLLFEFLLLCNWEELGRLQSLYDTEVFAVIGWRQTKRPYEYFSRIGKQKDENEYIFDNGRN